MHRREFLIQSCKACLSGGLVASTLAACSTTRYVDGVLEGNSITVLKSDFIDQKKDKAIPRPYVLVHNSKLEFPIYLFNNQNDQYTALLMKCTHQGSELNASGDHLYCSSHGSEFDKNGKVTNGPAEKKLRSFPVRVEGEKIFVELT